MSAQLPEKQKIIDYIVEELLLDYEGEVTGASSLFEGKILDSLSLLELISHLEEEFSIKIGSSEITIENLDSVDKICAFIEKKKSS